MITGINHITFATKNLALSLNFYMDILRCELIAKWDKGAYLQAGTLWLCLSLDSDAQTSVLRSYTHIAFNVAPQDFEKLKQRCLDNNIPLWKANRSEGASLYILDPDFHKLEIHYSTLKNRLESMRESPYQNQTIVGDV